MAWEPVKESTGCLCVMFVVGWFVGASGKSAVGGFSVESAGLAGKGMCKVNGSTAVLDAGKGVGFRETDGGRSAIAMSVTASASD